MNKIIRTLMVMAIALPMLTSCVDVDAIWDKFGEIENRLDSLTNELTKQAEAMNAMLSDGSVVSDCAKNADGSYTLTLSDGTEFTVLPEGTDFSTLVTFVEVDGQRCWATYDANGDLVVLKEGGNPIPVSADISVKLKDGAYYLVINGKEYVTGYDSKDVVQVFSSCEFLEDATGNIYAVKFEFGEGLFITVAFDGYAGVVFKLSAINNSILSDYYIDYGASQTFLMEMNGVVDYVMQVPDGWRVKVTENELLGETYLKVTAPTAETVALGAAVADGDLKVVSVIEGGKASVSKIYVSTDPFKIYDVTALKAEIKPYNGVQKFAYGVLQDVDFDEEAVVVKVNELLKSSSTDLPKGYFISESPLNSTMSEILGSELSEESSYVFWALPVLYSEGDDEQEPMFYAVKDMLRILVLNPMLATVEVSGEKLLDADLKVVVRGADAVYAGTAVAAEGFMEEILYMVNNDILTPISGNMKYEGLVSGFPTKESSVTLEPETDYAVWVIPVKGEKKEYTASDVVYNKFSTKAVAAGGSLKVSVPTPEVTASSITASLSSENAAMIYYAFFSETDGKRYSSAENATKFSKIQESSTFTSVRGSSAKAVISGLAPNMTKYLFAVAVGADGLYGEVITQSAKTSGVSFNGLSVSVSSVSIFDDEAILTVAADGDATDFIYWVGYEKDQFWTSEDKCASSKNTAAEYMAANPDCEEITKAMRKGTIEEDGTLHLKDLNMNTTYVFLALAKDESGKYSKAGYYKFTTLAADLGDLVVTGTEKWNTAKKFIEENIVWHEETFHDAMSDMGYASYSFGIKIPTDLTAYITCFGTLATDMTEKMVEIENYCSRSVSVGKVVEDENGEQPCHPDWYDDNGKLIEGSLVNIYSMYPHGSPTLGAVTLFPSSGHSNCTAWDNGECSSYKAFMESIAKYCSLDYWREYIIDFGNYAYGGDPNHEYSRTLTDPEKIETIAQQYLDIYSKYYKDAKPQVFVNDGNLFDVLNREAMGVDDDGVVGDIVTVMLKDAAGNYYEPMYFQVPNYFTK